MWNLKYNTNEHICEPNILTDIENRLVVAKEGWGEGWSGSLGLIDANSYI